jgi:uncharacterized membrane protein
MQILASAIRTPNVHTAERWASIAAGSLLAGHALSRGRRGVLELLAGAAMIERGITGKCRVYRTLGIRTTPYDAALPYELGVRARASITIAAPRQQVFEFWRNLQNLPRFMRHLVSVELQENNRSRWIAEGPRGRRFQWDTEIVNETPNELIAWKSLPGSDIDSAGSVRFSDAPAGRGTELRIEMQYNPPAGTVGAYIAKLLGREPEKELSSDLRRLKQFLECGEIATTDGQPQGPSSKFTRTVEKTLEEAVA